MRNGERGTRSTRVGVAARGLTQLFRVPTSAFRLCLFVAACTPITTRPDFRPDPRALSIILDARPERVTTMLDSLVAAESLEVARANVRDGYVETAWYDPQAHRVRHHEREITNRGARSSCPARTPPRRPRGGGARGSPAARAVLGLRRTRARRSARRSPAPHRAPAWIDSAG